MCFKEEGIPFLCWKQGLNFFIDILENVKKSKKQKRCIIYRHCCNIILKLWLHSNDTYVGDIK